MTRTLYICYFGLREPLVQTQVLPYLRELRKDDVQVTLLTFEPSLKENWTAEQIDTQRGSLADEGIDWQMLAYHKRPSLPATAYDVIAGALYIRRLLKKTPIDVLHARVHIPALMAVLVRRLSRRKPKILFDIRGFVPEEYADAGVWRKDGILFRVAKLVERWIKKESDGFVVLTEAARDVLFPESRAEGFDKRGRPVEVIPCSVDFRGRFGVDQSAIRQRMRSKLSLNDRRVIVHVGALVGLYLAREIVEFLACAKRRDPSVFALFLTQSDPAEIVAMLRAAGFGETDFLVTKVGHAEVPAYLCASDIGLSFVQSSFATISRSPTKIPEYLACGLPVIANSGVGDVDALILNNQVGSVIDKFDVAEYEKAFDEVLSLDDVRERAIATAKADFDLETVGGERYRRLYRRLVRPDFKAIYISYFGIRQPLVQTQVLPYLRELKKGRYPDQSRNRLRVWLVTFEPGPFPEAEAIRSELEKEGITWYWLSYHKRPSAIASGWDTLRGATFIRRLISREHPDIIHGRVHIGTLLGAIARSLSKHKPKLLFDIRGFMPEEYVDAGVWPENGWLFRMAKRVERWLMKKSDGFVVLTENAREILFPESKETGFDKRGRPVEVIPCCVDSERFNSASAASREEMRDDLNLNGRFVVAYVGAFGGWYLTKETADFYGTLRKDRRDAFALVLSQSSPDVIEELLRERGYGPNDFLVTEVAPADVARYLSAADAAVSFIKSCYSKQASSPTKNAEYLACGLPIAANAGVGDVDSLISGYHVGTIVHDLSSEGYSKAIDDIGRLENISEHCRRVAREQFDLQQVGGVRYRKIYQSLLDD